MRNPRTLEAHEQSFAKAYESVRTGIVNSAKDPDTFVAITGLSADGVDEASVDAAMAQNRLVAMFKEGSQWRLSVQRLYEDAGDAFEFRPVGLRVPANPDNEFLLGDYPAFGVMRSTGEAGVDEFVGAVGADEVVMPIAPRLAITIGATSGVERLTDAEVEAQNRLQVAKAQQYVHFRPSALFGSALSGWHP